MSEKKSLHIWTGLIVCGWLFVLGPGSIDGQLFPVVTDVHLSAYADPDDDQWVYVTGGFTKTRDSCSPRLIEWFLGDRATNDTPVEYVWGKPEVRGAGEHRFYDWHVRAAPPDVLENNTYADVLHQCGLTIPALGWNIKFPWLTRTVFWN